MDKIDHTWRLHKIEFTNMFNNSGTIDLAKSDGQITGIRKSSLVEIILYCLYNKGNPSSKKSFSCSIVFSVRNTMSMIKKIGKNTITQQLVKLNE